MEYNDAIGVQRLDVSVEPDTERWLYNAHLIRRLADNLNDAAGWMEAQA